MLCDTGTADTIGVDCGELKDLDQVGLGRKELKLYPDGALVEGRKGSISRKRRREKALMR